MSDESLLSAVEPDIPPAVLRKALEAVQPGDVLLVSDVDWDLKSPCDDCPFLRTSPFHQGVASAIPKHVEAIQAGAFAHTCHKTDCRPSVDGPKTFKGRAKHCAGALMMLLKTGKGFDLQLPLLQALEQGKFDCRDMLARAKADQRVFTLSQFLAFYERRLGKHLRHRRRAEIRKQKKSQRRRRSR